MMSRLSALANKEWPYWLGGLILGLINILFLWVTWEPLGITTTMSVWGGAFLDAIGFSPDQWDYYGRLELGRSLMEYTFFSEGTWLNLGITVGALIAALLAGQFRVRPIKSIKYATFALLGGFLMGYGARIAPRCNIGALLGGIPSMSLQGWVFALFAFLGAGLGARIVVRYFVD